MVRTITGKKDLALNSRDKCAHFFHVEQCAKKDRHIEGKRVGAP